MNRRSTGSSVRSRGKYVSRDMSLAVPGADAGACSAADATATEVDDHDHTIELTTEIVLFAIEWAENFTYIIYAVKVHNLARADFKAATAADAGRTVDGG